MEEKIKLATQVLVLLGALIGLIQIMKAGSVSTKRKKAEQTATQLPGSFDHLIELIGIYGAMLMPLLYMVAFMGLISLMSTCSTSSSSSTAKLGQKSTEISNDLDHASLSTDEKRILKRIEAASGIHDIADRDRLMTQAVSEALRAKSHRVAIKAALEISKIASQDDALESTMSAALQAGDHDSALRAARAIKAVSKHDAALAHIFKSLDLPSSPTSVTSQGK